MAHFKVHSEMLSSSRTSLTSCECTRAPSPHCPCYSERGLDMPLENQAAFCIPKKETYGLALTSSAFGRTGCPPRLRLSPIMPGAEHKVIVVIILLFISDSSRDVLYDSSLKSRHRFLENRTFSLLFIGFESGAIYSYFAHSSSFFFF